MILDYRVMNLQNTSVVLNLVLAIVVVVLGVRLASGKAPADKSADAEQSSNAEQAVLDNIATRTSIRDYEARPVENEKVDKMLRAAMAAPTAMNKQPWHFVVVDQRAVLDTEKMIEGGGRDFWIQDASAATENLLLAAHAMGLGAVWTGAYPAEERCKAISKALSLSDNLIPLNMVVIGYPAERPQPKDKFKEENISYNVDNE